jgi:hypothetical protein
MLEAVDRSTGGAARSDGFDPGRLSGAGDVAFTVSRSLDDGPDDYTATYTGVVRQAGVRDAALGLSMKAAAIRIDGTLDRLDASGDAQLGPYRGPLTYAAAFPVGRPMTQRGSFDGWVDASTVGADACCCRGWPTQRRCAGSGRRSAADCRTACR